MLEALIALAALAGNTVVAAATTDAWEACRRGFVRLLGRGDVKKAELAEQRLAETHNQLATAARADVERARPGQEGQGATRLADLLGEDAGGGGGTAVGGGGDPGAVAGWGGVRG